MMIIIQSLPLHRMYIGGIVDMDCIDRCKWYIMDIFSDYRSKGISYMLHTHTHLSDMHSIAESCHYGEETSLHFWRLNEKQEGSDEMIKDTVRFQIALIPRRILATPSNVSPGLKLSRWQWTQRHTGRGITKMSGEC